MISQDSTMISKIKTGLAQVFGVKDLGLAQNCLGIEMRQEKGIITLSQKTYIENLFGMAESKPVATLSDVNAKLKPGPKNNKNTK